MKTPIVAPLAALVLLGVAVFAGRALSSSGARPQRLVYASVTVDGELVLRGSTSDDGHPDADAVWGYLLELEFQPTEAFASLGIDAASEKVTLGWLKGRENAHRGDPPKIELDVAYGGRDEPFRLGLVRSPGEETWRVDPETVERRFSHRRITRAQAALLSEPKRRK